MPAGRFDALAVLGGLTQLGLATAGSSLDALSGGLHISLMGLRMTAPMVGWMAYRGHTTAQNAEMAGSMIVPSTLAAVLTWAGALDTASGLAVQHAIMLPAMLGVMLWRSPAGLSPLDGSHQFDDLLGCLRG